MVPKAINTLPFDRLSGWLSCLLIFVAPFVYFPGLDDFADLPKTVFIQLGVCLLLILWVFHILSSSRATWRPHPLKWAVLLFIGWAGISVLWAHNGYEAVVTGLHWLFCGLFFLAVARLDREKWGPRFLFAIQASVFGVAALGCLQYLLAIDWIPQLAPPAATFANRNSAVHIVSMGLPMMLCVAFAAGSRWSRAAGHVAATVAICYLIYTTTRAGWVALLVVLLILFAAVVGSYLKGRQEKADGPPLFHLTRGKAWATVASFLFILVMANLGPDGFRFRLGELAQEAATVTKIDAPTSEERVKASGGRLALWENSLRMVKDYPLLGVGLGNFKVFSPKYHQWHIDSYKGSSLRQPARAHNDFIQMWAELGLVGLGVFLAVLGISFFAAWRGYHEEASPEDRVLSLAVGLALVGFVVEAFFDFPMEQAVPPFYLFALLAVLVMNMNDAKDGGSKRSRTIAVPTYISAMLLLTVVSGSLFLARFHLGNLQSDRLLLLADQYGHRGLWEEARHAGKKALDKNPFRIESFYYIGHADVQLGRPEQGVDALRRVVQGYPYHINALLSLGNAYAGQGKREEALETYGKVIELKHDYTLAYGLMADVFVQYGAYESALAVLQKASAFERGRDRVFFRIGQIQLQRGRLDEAIEAFLEALKWNSELAHAHGLLAEIYLKQRHEGGKARFHMKRYVELVDKGWLFDRFSKLLEKNRPPTTIGNADS